MSNLTLTHPTYEEIRLQFLRDGTHSVSVEIDGYLNFICNIKNPCELCQYSTPSLYHRCMTSARFDQEEMLDLIRKEMPEEIL